MLAVSPEQRRKRYERLGLEVRFEGSLIALRFVGVCALHENVETILPSGRLLAIASFGSSERHRLSVGPPGRRPETIWMLTSAATRSVACEHSSRMRTRLVAFSWTLPIEPLPSLRVSPRRDRLVRGRTPPRPSTSAVLWLRSRASSSASRASAWCRRRGAAGSAHGRDPFCAA